MAGTEFSLLGPGGPGLEGPQALPCWLQVWGRGRKQD